MADSEVLKKLKDVPYRIQTASIKERRLVFEEIQEILSNPDVTEPIVRFVCRVLSATLHRYRDSTSQSYIKKLLCYLCLNHKEWTLKNLPPVILEISEQLSKTGTSKNTSQSGLYTLRWSTVVVENGLKSPPEGVDYKPIVLGQANLLATVTAFGDDGKNEKAYKMLHNAWSSCGKDQTKKWLEVLLEQAPDSGPHLSVMFSALCRHMKEIGEEEPLALHKTKMLDSFTKSLISVKSRPNANYIKASSDLLNMLEVNDVQQNLLPSLQKAMLRSPETIIEAVGEVIGNMEREVDGAVLDIGKSLIGNLNSKDEWVRVASSQALSLLSSRVTLSVSLDLMKHLFNVYNGSGGKLTSSEDKIAVLQGARTLLNQSRPKSDGEKLYEIVSKQVSKLLEAESHEKTICSALDLLAQWMDAYRGNLQDIVQLFKKNSSGKSVNQSVRIAYLCAMCRAMRSSDSKALEEAKPISSIVQAMVDKAIQQPVQPLSACEAICGLSCLVQLDLDRKLSEKTSLWSALTNPSKHLLLHDKYISTASDDVLTQVVYLCCDILKHYPSAANEKTCPVYKALIGSLLSQNKQIRDISNSSVKVLMKEVNVTVGRYLLERLTDYLSEYKYSKEDKSDVTGKIILDCVHSICFNRDFKEDEAQLLALEALYPCHHPLVIDENKKCWTKLVSYLKLDPKRVVLVNANNLKNLYISGYTPSEITSNIVTTLLETNAPAIANSVIQYVINVLTDEAIAKITRDEYFTFLTPDGELYDKSVIPGNDNNNEMNLKRESKTYSYKDQLEELQLRREIEEKQRKEGKLKEVPLTAKQKEAIKIQTAKENAIKERLAELDNSVQCCMGLLRCAWVGSCSIVRSNARDLIPALVKASRSPLPAERVVALYREFGEWMIGNTTLAYSVAATTLRLVKPQCDLPSSWLEEPLPSALVRSISSLHSSSVAFKAPPGEQRPFSAPTFNYVFALLKEGLTSQFVKQDEATLLRGLQVISYHADKASEREGEQPSLLPIDQMFRLLIDMISSTNGRVQSTCSACLLSTAQCSARGAIVAPEDIQCLLSGLHSEMQVVRDACLRALLCLDSILSELLDSQQHSLEISKRLFVARFDVAEDNRDLANDLWDKVPLASTWLGSEPFLSSVLIDIQHPVECIQRSGANALANLAEHHGIGTLVDTLIQMYRDALPLIPAKLDQLGHIVCEELDEWSFRRGPALSLVALAPHLENHSLTILAQFFVHEGLMDRNQVVAGHMLDAAMAIVDLHGKESLSSQLPVFEKFLDSAPHTRTFDGVRQSVVLLVGSLAKHLEPDDPRIKPITMKLIAALSTPSQQVQESVSNCLPHLVTAPALKDDVQMILNKLVKQLLGGDKYGHRKGAAYGIAGVVKGFGILALKQMDVMNKLTEAIQDKKNYKNREGALFAFEALCNKLGRLFEPYVVHVLPHLLACLGDSSMFVRSAAEDTAKLIMSRLSAHGVKLVLPALLDAHSMDNWRTKAGSVELLGAMAYCAPKQLSSCLPSIVPKLIEVLSDSHPRVQEAGADALKVIGSVIRNPEIQAIVPILLKALQDPSNKTSVCLQTLLDTKFVHFIDAPSLALIMPVVERAFLDRSTETRKMAAQIIGNMYSLTDQKDLTPYLPNIIPGLKTSLLDPVPEVRSVSARALGAMVRGLGESSFEQLLPWLMSTLTSEASSVDRSGAAQGLAELVAGLGVHKLHKLMPDIIATAERTDIAPHVKDGYIMMFIYMPGAFTDEFTPYIGQIIKPILKALADENEYVRETALKAGQRIVNLYAETAIALLLPELERGLFDDNWRIRYASVQLLGDLLFRISGVTGKMSTETASEDDNFGTEQSHSAILSALGPERRDRVLAGLYMGRSDVALMVRQAALHVWKVVVTNTPKTLREILPTLFGLLLGCLASTSYDKRQVAARTLGDLVRKLGERVLPEIVPILERGLRSDRSDQRQGVCIGLGEIIASTSRDSVLLFADGLVPTVRTALSDPLPEVRLAAAKTFDSLHATIGAKALDDIVPSMLEALSDPDKEKAEATLDGLRQVMAIKARAVLPYLIPILGVEGLGTRALAALGAAGGEALSRHLPKVLPALLAALEATPQPPMQLDNCRDALLPVVDDAGVRCIIDTLLESSRNGPLERRRASASLLCAYVSHTKADLSPYVPQLLRGLLVLFASSDSAIVSMSWEALNNLTKGLEPEKQILHVADVRQAIRYASSDLKGELLPGFCLPKGIAPILPLFRESILNGLPEDKENAALMLGEVIKLTSAAAIQPSVVHVTGPLIRILGDRFTPNVKAAVLETLALLLAKVGPMLKQFLPQLQTTFLKALYDNNRIVRIKAGSALSQLVLIHTRADPLFLDMLNNLKANEDPALRETTFQALRSVLTLAGAKLSEGLAVQLLSTLSSAAVLGASDEQLRLSGGGCLGALLHALPIQHREAALNHHVLALTQHDADSPLLQARSAALMVALKETPDVIYKDLSDEKVDKVLLQYLASDKVPVVSNGLRAVAYLFRHLIKHDTAPPHTLLTPFVRSMNHSSNDVKQIMCRACTLLGRECSLGGSCGSELLRMVLPALVNGTKEKNNYVRANSETALRAVLRLPHDEQFHLQCLSLLEAGARESLSDVVTKVLRRATNDGKDEELDCTLVT